MGGSVDYHTYLFISLPFAQLAGASELSEGGNGENARESERGEHLLLLELLWTEIGVGIERWKSLHLRFY